MSKPPRDRAVSSSNTYFVTISAYQQQSLFQRAVVAELFIRTFLAYRDQQKFLIHEFVVMPNHAHLLRTQAQPCPLSAQSSSSKVDFRSEPGRN
jgi:REP element-mobilizing transposase RayT